jgi:hypothetical protein
MKLMICSSVNLLFLMPVILLIDGLPCLYAGTAGRGQVTSAIRSSELELPTRSGPARAKNLRREADIGHGGHTHALKITPASKSC